MLQPLKIAVFGTGGVGGFFGGRLASVEGAQVTLIARDAHLAVIQEHGLTVCHGSDSTCVKPFKATDAPETIGVVDVVLVCTKAWQVPEAASAIKASGMMGPNTAVVPLQNGLSSVYQLREVLGDSNVCGGLCRLFGFIEAPGHIKVPSGDTSLDFGGLETVLPAPVHKTMQGLSQAFSQCGVLATFHTDVWPPMWAKFIFISVMSAVGAVSRVTWGEVCSCPKTWEIVEMCLAEAIAVAKGRGIDLGEQYLEELRDKLKNKVPRDLTTSMQRDIMDGKPSELDAQIGSLAEYGRQAGVATPTCDTLYALLLPLERRARSA